VRNKFTKKYKLPIEGCQKDSASSSDGFYNDCMNSCEKLQEEIEFDGYYRIRYKGSVITIVSKVKISKNPEDFLLLYLFKFHTVYRNKI